MRPPPLQRVWAYRMALVCLGVGWRCIGRHLWGLKARFVWPLGACVAELGASLGHGWLGAEGAALFGALLVGVSANVYAHPESTSCLDRVPGIMVLVPRT